MGPISLGYCISSINSVIPPQKRVSPKLDISFTLSGKINLNPPHPHFTNNSAHGSEGRHLNSLPTHRDNKLSYARAGESDMEFSWDQTRWFQLLEQAYKGIINVSLIEANVKVLTRWYYVPSRLATIYPDSSPLCYRGCNLVSSMFHMW